MQRLQWTPELSGCFWNDLAGSAYLENMSFANLSGYPLFQFIRPFLKPKGSHLDFGAGDGYLVGIMLREGYATAAFEPSARAENLTHDFGQHPLYLGTLGPQSEGRFDVVILSEVIEHLFDEDIPMVLNAIRKYLPDDGTLIVTTPNNENREAASIYCPTCRHLFHPWQHVRSFTAESLSAVLSEYGFERHVAHQVDFRERLVVSPQDRDAAAALELQKTVERTLRDAPEQLAAVVTRALEYQAANQPQIEDGSSTIGLSLGARDRLVYIGRKKPLPVAVTAPKAVGIAPVAAAELCPDLLHVHDELLDAAQDFFHEKQEFLQANGREIGKVITQRKLPNGVEDATCRTLEHGRNKVLEKAGRVEQLSRAFRERLESAALRKHFELLPMYLAALKIDVPAEPMADELARLGQALIARKLRKHTKIAGLHREVEEKDRKCWKSAADVFGQHVEMLRDLLQLPPCKKKNIVQSYGHLARMNRFQSSLIFRIGRKLRIHQLAHKLGLLS